MQIKTFTDKEFNKAEDRIEKLDKIVNDWLQNNKEVDIANIQRNEDGDISYITICYEV